MEEVGGMHFQSTITETEAVLWKEVTMVTVRRGRMNEHELKRLTVDHDRDGNSNWSTAHGPFDQDVIDIMKRCFSDRYQFLRKRLHPAHSAYIESRRACCKSFPRRPRFQGGL
jgi:hypothetical protein